MTVTGLLEAVEQAISDADAQQRSWWARWTGRRDVVLWLIGADQLPSLGVTATTERRSEDGSVEFGYTLAATRKIRDRLYAAFREYEKSVE